MRITHATWSPARRGLDPGSREFTTDAMKPQRSAGPENRLLASLPDRNRRRFLAACDQVELGFGDILCEGGDRIRHVYFPVSGFISLVATLEDGCRLEIGIVGDEGMLGISLVLGVNTTPHHALVQGAGTSLRMTAAAFQKEIRLDTLLRQRLDRYIHVLTTQLAQTAACTHYHLIEARLARWLLLTRDRAHSDEFHLTHEFLAYMLGVRRVGITRAAGALLERGLIRYSRGEIAILNGAGLQAASCPCYVQANRTYELTLGPNRRAA